MCCRVPTKKGSHMISCPMGGWLLCTIKEEKISKMREHMLDYLVALLHDAQDFFWGAVKASHAVLLCRMEQGEIADYSCIDQIDRIRRANARRHISPKKSTINKKGGQKPTKVMTCTFFNQNSCSFGKTHETKGVLYRHMFTLFRYFGKKFWTWETFTT